MSIMNISNYVQFPLHCVWENVLSINLSYFCVVHWNLLICLTDIFIASTIALAGYIWWGQVSYHVWWASHWNGRFKISRNNSPRQWLDRCDCWGWYGIFWDCWIKPVRFECNQDKTNSPSDSMLSKYAPTRSIWLLHQGTNWARSHCSKFWRLVWETPYRESTFWVMGTCPLDGTHNIFIN